VNVILIILDNHLAVRIAKSNLQVTYRWLCKTDNRFPSGIKDVVPIVILPIYGLQDEIFVNKKVDIV